MSATRRARGLMSFKLLLVLSNGKTETSRFVSTLIILSPARKVRRSMHRKDQRTRARRRHARALANQGGTETGGNERERQLENASKRDNGRGALSPILMRFPRSLLVGRQLLSEKYYVAREWKTLKRNREREREGFLSVWSGRYPRVRSVRRRDFRLGFELLLLLLLLQAGECRYSVVSRSRYMNLEESNRRPATR